MVSQPGNAGVRRDPGGGTAVEVDAADARSPGARSVDGYTRIHPRTLVKGVRLLAEHY